MGEQKSKGYFGLINYGLLVMTFTHTMAHAFQQMHSALYPVIKVEFSLTNQQLGLISSIPSLAAAILSIPAGLATDKFGTKRMILFSNIIAAIGALIAGFAQDPWMFILAVSLLYINTTFYHPASYSYTVFLFHPKDRSKALGIHGAGGTLGMALGPISISILVGILAFGWRQVYLAWVIPLSIGAIVVYFIKYSKTQEPDIKVDTEKTKKQAEKLFSTNLVMFLLFGALRTIAGGMTSTFLSLWLVNNRGLSLALTSLIFGVSSLMGILAAPIGGIFADRYGEKRWIVYTVLLSLICFSLAFLIPSTWAFIIFYIGNGFFNTLGMAANSAITAKLSPSNQRGLGYALYFLPGSVVGAFSPMIAAYIADSFGIFSIFMTSIVVFALSWILFKFGVNVE
ncbi:MFS transporter [Candidatus Bathyarchaeota archaeon]|nr:MFS transporter [Candidatus Bathyarchaeota archaeon]